MIVKKKTVIVFAVIAVAIFAILYSSKAFLGEKDPGQETTLPGKAVSAEQLLENLYSAIKVSTLTPVKGNVDLAKADMKEALPDISKYPEQVKANTSSFIEIFSSTEKATVTNKAGDFDRWLVDMAEAFNKSGAKVNGESVSVSVRGIASGLGMDYITSGKYMPDVFSPSNELWGDMLIASGVKTTLVEKKLIGNVAGIVLSKTKNQQIIDKYGEVSLKNVIEAVSAGEIAMGYTNPFASSTGANFLISTLYTFDNANPFSDTAKQAFEQFQSNVPYTAYTTLQMKDSASSGVLDGFVFEYQQFMNSPDLKNDYIFTPFGVRHDSPVYALGDLSAVKTQILTQFVAFCKTAENQSAGNRYGFGGFDAYQPSIANISGKNLTQAQGLWKEKKAGARDIISVFVADTSGSMSGEAMTRLKQSLLTGSKYINNDCSVGLVTFSDDVNIALPIGKFDINQRAYFTGAVNGMSAGGNTAMFDAIIVAEKLLLEAKQTNADAKLMIFVLTDGETNRGNGLEDTSAVIEGLRVPVYTIGYNADIAALKTVSDINEAASINADTDDVIYKIQSLFNAEM